MPTRQTSSSQSIRAAETFIRTDGGVALRQIDPDLAAQHGEREILISAGVPVLQWVAERIPDAQIVRFQHPGEQECFAWIDTQDVLLGEWGLDLLTTKLARQERGIPEACQIMLVPPQWRKGRGRKRETAREEGLNTI